MMVTETQGMGAPLTAFGAMPLAPRPTTNQSPASAAVASGMGPLMGGMGGGMDLGANLPGKCGRCMAC